MTPYANQFSISTLISLLPLRFHANFPDLYLASVCGIFSIITSCGSQNNEYLYPKQLIRRLQYYERAPEHRMQLINILSSFHAPLFTTTLKFSESVLIEEKWLRFKMVMNSSFSYIP